jgi:pimeloyl-ACP methyl ester carboxylesterase
MQMDVVSPYSAALAELPVRESTVSVLGSTTRYWEYGDPDASTTVVLVHGYRGEHHGLEPVVAQLRGIRLIAPDLPGFGESTPMTEAALTVEGYATWLREFTDRLGVTGTAVILGHSFGSIIVSHAVAGGLPTPKLILINPIAANALTGPKAILTKLTVFYYRSATLLPERAGHRYLANRAIVRFMSETMATTKNRELRHWIHDQHREYFSRFSDVATVVDAFDASIGSDVIEVAPRITVPTLLIASDKDPITTVANLHKLADLLPDAQLHILAGVGHLIHYERPREAAELIVDFLGVGSLAGAAS